MERRTARLPLAAAAAVAVAVVAAGGATAYASRYRPLAAGSTGGLQDARLVDDGGGQRYVLAYRDRTVVRGLLSVRNSGRWPVRVERVGVRPLPDVVGVVEFRPDRNLLNPPRRHGYAGPRFAPFTLAPGEERSVAVALWLDDCEHTAAGSIATVSHVPVRFRTFGMAHTADVALRVPWEIEVTAAACPRSEAPESRPG